MADNDDWVTVVEALYNYESTNARGHSVIVQPGELYYIIREIDEDWWFVGRSSNDEDGFYFPRTYGQLMKRQLHRLATAAGNRDSVASITANHPNPNQSIMANSFPSSTTNQNPRLSTFFHRRPAAGEADVDGVGIVGGGSLKRRSYQLATLTTDQRRIIDHSSTTAANIYDNPVALTTSSSNASNNSSSLSIGVLSAADNKVVGSAAADQSIIDNRSIVNVESAAHAASSLLRKKKTRGPGFKLADPNRISRSIPVDLNFVHHQQNQNRNIPPNERDEYEYEFGSAGEDIVEEEKGDHADSTTTSTTQIIADQHQPIYANLNPIGAKELPPLPVPGTNPINTLRDGWAEYMDNNNRHYFYNAKSRKATWKPPRLSGVSSGGKPAAVRTQSSVSSGDELDTSFVSSDDGGGAAVLPDRALSQSGGESWSFSVDPNQSSSSTTCSPVPPSSLTFNKESNGQHVLQATANGHTPTASANRAELDLYACSKELANIATSKLRTGSSSTDDHSPTAGSGPESGLIAGGQGHQQLIGHQQNFVRYGVLNRCKYMEAGKRVKKQWLPCFVYLTNAHLIFYKDQKAAEKKGNQYPTPLGVCDLRGAKLRWLEGDVSRRKNVFQVQLLDMTVYLFHAESQPEITSWYEDLRLVIDQLPVPDCYPTPLVMESSLSTSRFSSMRNKSKNAAPPVPPDLQPPPLTAPPKLPPALPSVASSPTKEADKRKSVSFSQLSSPPAALADGPPNESSIQQKESILEKLRKFFRHRPSVESLKERGIYKPEPVFGSSLWEICRREKRTVPKFIVTCTALIEEKGLNADGLYRINGNLSQVQRIRCQVDQEKFNALQNESDVHVLTGALKLFFRELQEPAFPTSSTKDFLNAIKLQNAKQRWKTFAELTSKLPRPHHDTLDHLFKHLLNVARHSAANRMQIHNLAIVFGPTLFSSNPSVKSSTDSKNTNTSSSSKSKKTADSDSTKFVGARRQPKSTFTSPSARISSNQNNHAGDVTHSNSQLAFTMILQGQILEYMLKEHARLFKSSPVSPAE